MSDRPTSDDLAAQHRWHAIDANNATWELIDQAAEGLSADAADDLLGRAYAAAYHWRRALDRTIENDARASWLLSRAHVVLGHGDLALHHADRCMAHVDTGELTGFDRAYAHEARARALACLGWLGEATAARQAASAVEIVDDEDRSIFESDLAADPWFGLSSD